MPIPSDQLELLSQQINHAHRSAVSEELSRRGLSEIGHPMLLTILEGYQSDDPEGHAQRDLAELLHISPAAVANSLKSLERGGYVRREPGQKDARRNRVMLTDKGRAAVEGCQAAFQAVSERMLAGFTREERDQLLALREQLRPYVGDVVTFIHEALAQNKTILLEGQLGSMKDPDLGIFPMTTSSHTLAGFGCVGAAVPPTAIEDIICVTKAYSSSVGSNTEPFVSEVTGQAGDELRRRGGDKGEFGATTGRPRRVGWFDTVATKYGCMVQGATQVALTCLDVLGYLDEIKVCVGYEIDGQVTDQFPVTPKLLRAKPVFETLPGWKCDVRGVTDYDALPAQAKAYVEFLESKIGVPITIVSTGPKRHEIALRK